MGSKSTFVSPRTISNLKLLLHPTHSCLLLLAFVTLQGSTYDYTRDLQVTR